jgi:CubicO group peptidase (beta-lactamase class C family)
VTHLIGGRTDPHQCAQFEDDVQVCATTPNINDYMQANLLEPLGMTSSGYLWTPAMQAHVAHGYDPDDKPLQMNRKPSGPSLARYGMAGGLLTTPTDYSKFLIAVIDPKPSDQYRLTKRSLDEMLRPQVRRNAESSWALGWEINHTQDGDFIRHGGGNPGFSCFVAGSVAQKSGYVIMTNREDIGYTEVIAPLITGDTLSKFIGGKLRGASE